MRAARITRLTGASFALLLSLSHSSAAGEPGSARDVTPDPATILGSSQSYAFGGQGRLLVTSGRAGFHRTDNGGEHWQRAMEGFVDSNGVEPFAFAMCQAPSTPATVYGISGAVVAGQPIFRTDDLGRRWRKGASVPTLPLDCAVETSDPDVVYVLAQDDFVNGSLLKSVDGGQTFFDISAALPAFFNPLAMRTSPSQPQVVYLSYGGDLTGLYVSRDGGASFARAPTPLFPIRIAPHPTIPGLVFIVDAFDSLLYRSENDGASFEQVGPQAIIGDVAFDPDNPAAVYVAAGTDGLYRSGDSGFTFSRLAGPAPEQLGQSGVFNVGIAPARGGPRKQVFVSTSRGPLRSDDGGQSFVPVHRDFQGAPVNDLAVDASGRLMVGALNSVMVFRARKAGQARAYDSFGVNLTALPGSAIPDWQAAAVAASPVDPDAAVVVTFFNGVYSTADGGATWTQATIAPSSFNYFTRATFAPGSATRVYMVSSGFVRGGLYRSDDAGRSFSRMSRERFGAIAVDPVDPGVAYLAAFDTGNGIFKTIDGGVTILPLGLPGNFSTLAIDPRDPRVIYASNRAGGILRSPDGGATWPSASTGLPPSNEVLAVAVDPRIASRAYAWVKAAGLFVSADGGGTWTLADAGESARRTSVEVGRASMAVDPVKPGRVYLGNSGVLQVDTIAGTADD